MELRSIIGRVGSHPAMVWAVKNVLSPLDRIVVRFSRGKLPPPSSLAVPTLLLTTAGRKSGAQRTIPLVYLADGDHYIVANARPPGERKNPWILNLRAAGEASIRVRGQTIDVSARQLDDASASLWWPELVDKWPAFAEHYAATGERSVSGARRWLGALLPVSSLAQHTHLERIPHQLRSGREIQLLHQA